MASSFSTNLGVEVMASGEKSGAWGDITNLNLNILDRVVSYGVLTASDLTTTLTIRLASPTSGGAVTSVGDSLQLTNNTAVAGTATALSIALG